MVEKHIKNENAPNVKTRLFEIGIVLPFGFGVTEMEDMSSFVIWFDLSVTLTSEGLSAKVLDSISSMLLESRFSRSRLVGTAK